MKSTFAATSGFTALAGGWLAMMELILKHNGYEGRIGMDLLMALQGIAALLASKASKRPPLIRSVFLVSAIALGYIGMSALTVISRRAHFEGFVVVIGIAIIVQAIVTTLVMLRPRSLL